MFLRKRLYFPLVKRPGREVASSAEVESNWSSTIMAWTRETLYILYIYIYIYICVCVYLQGVTGGTDQTSGGCSLC